MRKVVKFLAAMAAIVVAAGVQQNAEAAFVGAPMGLRGAIQYIRVFRPGRKHTGYPTSWPIPPVRSHVLSAASG